jgi:hypothetical protein
MAKRVVGVQSNRLVEIGQRLVEIAKLGERAAPIVVNIRVGLIELDGAIVKVERAGVIFLGGIGPAEVVVDAGVGGLELQRLIVVVEGEVVFVLLTVRPAAIAARTRFGGIELDGLGVVPAMALSCSPLLW